MFENYIKSFFDITANTVVTNQSQQSQNIDHAIELVYAKLSEVKQNRKTVYLVGNGGSNAIVSHMSIDLINACKIKAYPLTESSQLTCFGNDYGYENVFSKQLETCFDDGDLLIAVSSSGNSKNILNAVEVAKKKNVFVLTFSGFQPENYLRRIGDLNFWINCSEYGKVEIGHALLCHIITDYFLSKLK